MRATNIKWDTDGDEEILAELPREVLLPEKFKKENYMMDGVFDSGSFAEDVADWLSDTYEFCVFGFDYDFV